jgi:lipopolysaccharide export system permease protein
MLSELAGPFLFGLSAFTLIFAATQIIAIGRIVSETHAPLWAAIEVFVWQLPGIIVLAIPMALLLGTLLAIQRLSGESEITAMKAGGITFLRIVAPILIAGFVMSFVTLVLQERLVPYAREEANVVQNTIINKASAFASSLNVSAPLPGGGSQMTFARACAQNCEALLGVTLVQYDRDGNPTRIVFADRAVFQAQKWTLDNARIYQLPQAGSSANSGQSGITTSSSFPTMQVELGQNPTELVKRAVNNNPDDMNRAEIADLIRSGQLSASELKKYTMVYQQKLATPFACFVFTLLAVPYGIRAVRGGGSTSLGFGLAVLIVFVYYIVSTVFSYIGEAYLPLALPAAWMPNLIFTAIGARRLYRAAMT